MTPRITVVIPMYNVESFLAECLESVANQTLRDLDVVMVDDGSTDGTADIAADMAARDPRFRLVRQENAGLGAARNAGVRNAHPDSTYLVFLDSDDIVPEYAYQLGVETLESTGSDFVTGNVLLLDSTGSRQSGMHRASHGATKLRDHITRNKTLVHDRLAPNKIFRRSFWDKFELAFPEGVLYEDTPLIVPAHFRAKSVDVLKDPIYYWRQREGGGASITQRRTELSAVRDRIAAVDQVSRFIAALPDTRRDEYKRWYDISALANDIRIFIQVLPEADDEFRALFMDRANDFLSRVDPKILEDLPSLMRLKWHLIAQRQLPELLEVLSYEKKNVGGSIPVHRRLHRYAKYPFFKDTKVGVPDGIYRLDREFSLRTRTTELTWTATGLTVKGHAHLNNINIHKKHMSVKVIGLRNSQTGQSRIIPVRTVFAPEATTLTAQARYCYDWAGFEATMDFKRFQTKGRWENGTWRVAMGVLSRGLHRRGGLSAGTGGSATHPAAQYVEDDVRLVPLFGGGKLQIRVEVISARITGHRPVPGGVELKGVYFGAVPAADATPIQLRLEHLGSRSEILAPLVLGPQNPGSKGRPFTATLDFDDIAAGRSRNAALPSMKNAVTSNDQSWRTTLLIPSGGKAEPETVHIAIEPDAVTGRYTMPGTDGDEVHELVLVRNAPGHLLIRDSQADPRLSRATWTLDGELFLEGTYPFTGSEAEVVLRYVGHHEEISVAAECSDNGFRAHLRPAAIASFGSTLPIRSGTWEVLLRHRTADGVVDRPMRLASALLESMPSEVTVTGRRYVLDRKQLDNLSLEVHSDLGTNERGPYAQKLLRQEVYPQARTQPLRHAVLYDSYTGKQFSDTPRAVYEELVRRDADVEHLWIVRDQQVDLPEGVTPVRYWGADWYEALGRCKYIVTNAHLPDWIQRRPGQVIVQAWHGTPLKKIGWDIEDVQFANNNYLEKVARESKSWSFMVSPNRFSTPILERAMAFDGEILEAGYPRNDMLYAADREERAAEVRRRIGIPEGKQVVLYAPTWRDDQFYGPGRYKLDLQLDLQKAREVLGDDHVLMIRKHPNVVDHVPGAGNGFVYDVSEYPDIAELFLVADALVTDYSSLMFDYANTGRPILFFTYDLEHYRDTLRGFYFDFSERAPGPLISTSDELIAALRDIDSVARTYAPQYERFQRDFCDLDDGKAAARVIDRMFELGASE